MGGRNSKKVGLIANRNQSMLVDPNYSILNEDSSASEDEQENSFIKVKESLASTGTNNTYKMLLMLVEYVIRIRSKVVLNAQSTSTEELKKLAQSQSVLRNIKITSSTVSCMGNYINRNKKVEKPTSGTYKCTSADKRAFQALRNTFPQIKKAN